MDLAAERRHDIEQGLRDETGALTFCLDALDYSQGHSDFAAGTPAPRDTSPSYDLGRYRAGQKAEAEADTLAVFRAEEARRSAAIRDILKDRPDLLAQLEADLAKIRTR